MIAQVGKTFRKDFPNIKELIYKSHMRTTSYYCFWVKKLKPLSHHMWKVHWTTTHKCHKGKYSFNGRYDNRKVFLFKMK